MTDCSQDITTHKPSEAERAWQSNVNAAIAELSEALIAPLSLDDIAFLILEHAKRFTGSAFGFVGRIDPHTGYMISSTMTRDIWDVCQVADKTAVFEKFSGLWGWVLDHRQPLLTNTPSDDERSSGTPPGHIPIQRFLSVPAMANGNLVGQIALANPDRDYTPSDLAAVERMASLYALAIQRQRVQDSLRESEERYRTLIENVTDSIILVDENGMICFANPAAEALFDRPAPGLVGQPFSLPLDQNQELDITRRDEQTAIVEMRVALTERAGAKTHLVSLHDITERKQAEKQLKTSLHEKEVLLKEIHHRVKNNLQIISSLLSLQAGHITDPATREIFKESQNRVRSMALIHEKLYRSDNLARIDFAEYIRNLVMHLFRSYAVSADTITFQVESDSIFLDIDRAVPCALIINELVGNCFKHAFPGGRPGHICVTFRQATAGSVTTAPTPSRQRYTLQINDNGIGFPSEIDFRNTNSLGLELVTTLTGQLDGKIEMEAGQGTTFRISFEA